MTKVSVIIPVYNVEKYLRQCLDSIVNQTLKEIEIICVDDGSTDSSPAILAEYSAKDPRVKVLTREKSNAGAARNAGMAVATGEYLGFVDSDDWCELTLFEKAYKRAKETDTADLVFFGYDQYDSVDRKFKSGRKISDSALKFPNAFRPVEMGRFVFTSFNFAPWNRIVRRHLIEENQIKFQEQIRCNDLAFGCVSIACAEKISVRNEVLYHYRIAHGGNLQSRNEQTPLVTIKAWLKTAEDLIRLGVEPVFRRQLLTDALGSMFYVLNGWTDLKAQRCNFDLMVKVFKDHEYFSKLAREDILNSQTLDYLQCLLNSASAEEYALKIVNYQRNRMSELYREKVSLSRLLSGFSSKKVLNELKLHVIICAEDENSANIIENALVHQTCKIASIIKLVSPTAAELREAVATLGDEPFEVVRSIAELSSSYYLERRCLEIRLGKTNRRQDFEVLALPTSASDVFKGLKLSDRLKIRLAEAAGAFFRTNRLSMVGDYLRLICDLAQIYTDAEDRKFFAALLHKVEYVHCRDLLSNDDWKTIRISLDELHNLDYEHVELILQDVERIVIPEVSTTPDVSYIVPVYNVAPYLYRSIESLRRQTLRNIEIICVDDESTDGSAAILDEFAKQDKRIKVIHKPNSGLGMTRNAGLDVARGRFVLFFDGDDWAEPTMAQELVSIADREALEVLSFDLALYDHETRKALPSWWNLRNRAQELICERVIKPGDLSVWNLQASACLYLFRREFLERNKLRFGKEKFGEDLNFSLKMYPLVERYYIHNKVYYHYRRNVPGSQVARMTAGVVSEEAFLAQRQMFEQLAQLLHERYLPLNDEHLVKLFLNRVLKDVLFYAKKSSRLSEWFCEIGWKLLELDRIEAVNVKQIIEDMRCAPELTTAPKLLKNIRMRIIEALRARSKHDLYIVTGQLNSKTNESIDSWTLFTALCARGIPARYVVWKENQSYRDMKESAYGDNVIGLNGDGVADEEFLKVCCKELVRARAVVQENIALNFNTRTWLRSLKDCAYVFLQHGVFFTTFSDAIVRTLNCCNYVNVSSPRERDFILGHLTSPRDLDSDKLIIGGLPRWDLVKDLSSELRDENVVFVMLTWRSSFNDGMIEMKRSAYLNRLKGLLNEENIKRWNSMGIRVVLAPHHHLANHIRDLDFGLPVEVASTDKISYWIRHAKMLVTDFSSVAVDFLFQNKPTIFWILDHDDLRLKINVHDDGGKVKSALKELKSLYNVTKSVKEVEAMIERYAANNFQLESEKKAIAESFFAHKKDICRHVYESIEAAIKRDAEKEG